MPATVNVGGVCHWQRGCGGYAPPCPAAALPWPL